LSESKLKNRREFSAEFKARVCLELVRGDKTLSQMSAQHEIKETVLSRWKQEFIERSATVFIGTKSEQDIRLGELERALKRQEEEIAILKKALLLSAPQRGQKS
jgi:transposase-like protein